ncbi:MAG: NAD(P)H-hydrate dehydratase [Chthonomonas sp.]|nr:NAD(P)H-hydrate dehydratase [Chthonomonas sp.]
MWIATAAHAHRLDDRAEELYGLSTDILIERAGQSVRDAILEMLPEGGRVTFFCGKGNNGADGLYAATLVHQTGLGVEVLMTHSEDELNAHALAHLTNLRAQGIDPIFPSDPQWLTKAGCVACRDLVVDSVLGTGARGDVADAVRAAIRSMNEGGLPVISVDVPSGIVADSGEELGESVWASCTITMGLPKQCFFQGIGIEHSGAWRVADLGYPDELLREPTSARLIDREWVCDLLPDRLRSSHKGDHGHVLIVAGSAAMPGAAVLAAQAALRAGAGLVTVAGIESVVRAVSQRLPEALLLVLPEREGCISPLAVEPLLAASQRATSVVFGPGLSDWLPVTQFLADLWPRWDIPSVIDADALNAVSRGVTLPPGECVLTPHPGEMGRLMHCSAAEIQSRRFSIVEAAVQKFERTILLKGAYSIVGSMMQPLNVNPTGNPGMATGGMGDVLSGLLGTLLAQDLPPYLAASCGAYWHGLAADLCAEEIGPQGYLASEVAAKLPAARAKITAPCPSEDSCQLP